MFNRALQNALRIGAGACLVKQIVKQKKKAALRSKFDRWKISWLANKQGIKILTQTKTIKLMFSPDISRDDDTLSRANSSFYHNQNDDQT